MNIISMRCILVDVSSIFYILCIRQQKNSDYSELIEVYDFLFMKMKGVVYCM